MTMPWPAGVGAVPWDGWMRRAASGARPGRAGAGRVLDRGGGAMHAAVGGGGANFGAGLREVPMARTALARQFKAARDTPPHTHLRKLRIERVTEWLGSTRLPVGEIGPATGFEYPEYLSARFRRE